MTCHVQSCNRDAIARGWCPSHYKRWRRTGRPPDGPIHKVSNKSDTLADRLNMWSEPDGDCIVWTGYTNPDGYPVLNWKGKARAAHRLSYEAEHGLTDLALDHLCRNPSCINPDHLEPVSQAVNVQRGNLAKLTPEDVAMIRSVYLSGRLTQQQLAALYGVNRRTIGNVLSRKTWRNVG